MESIVVHGAIAVRPEEVERVTALAGTFAATCRDEDGCVEYALSWDVADPTYLRLIEHWESDAAYQVHRGQPHVVEWAQMITAAQAAPLQGTRSFARPYDHA